MYQYRVKEMKIGDHDVIDGTNDGQPETKCNDYLVEYDSTTDTTVTEITNDLIEYEPSQIYYAEKVWDDNNNQDGKRPEQLYVYLIQTKAEGTEDEDVEEFSRVLNEANGWKNKWENYPAYDPDGAPYTYVVREDETTAKYSKTGNTYNRGKITDDPDNPIKWEDLIFTNTHSQSVKSLTVDKDWFGENTPEDKRLRPASIEYELCCKYTAYKYVSGGTTLTDDADIAAAMEAETLQIVEDYTYDGPISQAEALLALYPDATWENEYNNGAKVYHYTKTLTPTDRTDDSQWENAVTFHMLPVYINVLGSGRWNGKNDEIEYYVREVERFGEGERNPYIYGASGDGETDHTTLLTGTEEANKTVTAENTLRTRDIEVSKVWVDNGYGTSLHYDIDFVLTCTSQSSGFTYSETKTLTAGQSSVIFEDLPEYDQNGAVLDYTVTEKVAGSSAASKYGYVETQTESHILIIPPTTSPPSP